MEKIKDEWETRITALIEMKPENFEPFDLKLLKKQGGQRSSINIDRLKKRDATITAVFHPPSLLQMRLSDLKVGSSVAVYSSVKTARPWNWPDNKSSSSAGDSPVGQKRKEHILSQLPGDW